MQELPTPVLAVIRFLLVPRLTGENVRFPSDPEAALDDASSDVRG